MVYNKTMKEPICKNCSTELVVKPTKKTASQVTKPYYYTHYYFCPHCKKLYHDEKFKVTNAPLFAAPNPSKNNVIPDLIRNPEMDSRLRGNDNEIYDVEIWTDGACVHNGTPRARAAWAFVSGKTERAGVIDGKQTNNVAEALAVYHALVWATEKRYRRIKLYTDSQITIFGVKKAPHLVKANQEIFVKIAEVITNLKLDVNFEKVLGHSGDINNDRVDKLANDLARKES